MKKNSSCSLPADGIDTDMHIQAAPDATTGKQCVCPILPCLIPKRWILAMLGQFGVLVAYSMRVNLSIGLVAMVNSTYVQQHSDREINPECPTVKSNSTLDPKPGVFNWDEKIQGYILASFYYGYIFTQIPGGLLATRYGGKWVFGLGVFGTAVLSIVTPIAAATSVYLLIAVRVIEGLVEGVTLPAMHQLIGKWSPIYERSKIASIVYTGASLGTLITYFTSGVLCDSDFLGGWPSVFYIYGTVGIIWFLLWSLLTASCPEEHKTISKAELEYIIKSRGGEKKEDTPAVPWNKMFASSAVWAVLISNMCCSWFFYTCLTSLPLFYQEVLGFSLTENGLASACPYVLNFIVNLLCGQAADFLRRGEKLSTRCVRKIFACITFFPVSLLLITVGYVGCSPVAAVAILAVATGSLGSCNSGPCINHIDIAPALAGVLMGITNTGGTAAGIVAPMVVGFLTENKPTRSQWVKVFFISSAVSAFGGIFFLIFASGEEQPWSQRKNREHEECDENYENEEKSNDNESWTGDENQPFI